MFSNRINGLFRLTIGLQIAAFVVLRGQPSPQRVLQRMSENLATQDYICSATVERSVTGKPKSTLVAEVGVINGKELFAWPSSDADVALLKDTLSGYTQGGSGAFAIYTRQVFRTNVATLYSAADETDGGGTANW